jgi:peptidoglycan-associated lipoprotein
MLQRFNLLCQKFLKLVGSVLILCAIFLVGCSSQQLPGKVGQGENLAQDAILPDAKTYGLVENRSPEVLAEPLMSSDALISSSVVNSAVAPSNQTYYFDGDSVTLQPSDLDSLRNQATYLIAHPAAKVRLEGYSDSQGSNEVNILVAYQWVQLVNAALLQDGVAPVQIEMVSYGKEKPAMDGFGEPVFAKNRKVQLVYEE